MIITLHFIKNNGEIDSMKTYDVIDKHLKLLDRPIPWLSKQTGISDTALRAPKYYREREYTLKNMVKIAIVLNMDLNELKKIDWR